MYQVSFENIERFMSYKVTLKFWDADDAAGAADEAKDITIT